jgi:capsular polysaccharide transport system permease protein
LPLATDPCNFGFVASYENSPVALCFSGEAHAERKRSRMSPSTAASKVLATPWIGAIRTDLRRGGLNLMFAVMVVLPASLATIYYTLIASDIYVSEAKFIVRGVKGQTIGGLASFFRTLGIARAEDDAFAVQNYMRSRDAVQKLDAKFKLARMYSRPGVDPISSFGVLWPPSRFEPLYQYYLSRVEVTHNDVTGITTLKVQAFTPQDAHAIATNLLVISEQLVNEMNDLASSDALKKARGVVADAEERVFEAQRKLTEYRNREKFLDPASESKKVLEVVAKLNAERSAVQRQISEILKNSPQSPALDNLRIREQTLDDQIALEQAKIVGFDDSLANKFSTFERLELQRKFADRALELALEAVDAANQETRSQQLYIQTIVQPNVPDVAAEPRRLRNVLAVILVSLAFWSMAWLSISGAKEHSNGSAS